MLILKNEFYPCKTFAYIYLRSFYECEITVSKKVAVFSLHEFCRGVYGTSHEELWRGRGGCSLLHSHF